MFKAFILREITSWLLGGNVFDSIQSIVSGLMEESMTGKEKREAAIRRVRALSFNIADFLVNLGIEVAVMYLRSSSHRV